LGGTWADHTRRARLLAPGYDGGVATFEADGLILDARSYRDRHQIVAVLTGEFGQLRGVWRNVRGGRAPQGAASQVLSAVRVSAYRGPTADLATFRAVELVRSSFPLATSIERSTAAAAVAETLSVFCPQEEPAPRRFRLGTAALDALLAGTPPGAVVSYVQFWCLRLGGFLPEGDEPEAWTSAGGRPVTEGEQGELSRFLTIPPKDVQRPPSLGLARWLDDAVRLHAESPLRALAFHRRMAADEGR
jgi:hypothetical protein